MFLQIVKQLVKSEGITEELKAKDQTEWVAQMNNVCYRAREIVNSTLISYKIVRSIERTIFNKFHFHTFFQLALLSNPPQLPVYPVDIYIF